MSLSWSSEGLARSGDVEDEGFSVAGVRCRRFRCRKQVALEQLRRVAFRKVWLRRSLIVALSPLLLLVISGCAINGTSSRAPAREGIAEYRLVTTKARSAMAAVLGALAKVSAQSNRCDAEVLSGFNSELQRLQVESLQLRARAQAMQARGDAYFEHWHENLANVKDPELRALAERQRPALEEKFRSIKRLSQEGREAFGPFLTSLRQCRNALEIDPGSLEATSTREQLGQAKENGEHVDRCLAGIINELDAMRELITPPGSIAQEGSP